MSRSAGDARANAAAAQPSKAGFRARAWRAVQRCFDWLTYAFGAVAIVCGLLFFGIPWPVVAAAVVGCAAVLIAAERAERKRKRREREAHARAIGHLEITDSEIVYTRAGRRHALRWEDLESVAYSREWDPYPDLLSTCEDEWLLRAPESSICICVPDCAEHTPVLLEWCARKLVGFDQTAHERSRIDPMADLVIECWRRTS